MLSTVAGLVFYDQRDSEGNESIDKGEEMKRPLGQWALRRIYTED
jgi:hypothetical protein